MLHYCNTFCCYPHMNTYFPRVICFSIHFQLSPNTFVIVTKEGLTWVEWITPGILAVIFCRITEVEKVMFICSMNHLVCLFNCTGRSVGILRYSLRARSNRTESTSFTQAHFWHSKIQYQSNVQALKGQNASSTSLFFPK